MRRQAATRGLARLLGIGVAAAAASCTLLTGVTDFKVATTGTGGAGGVTLGGSGGDDGCGNEQQDGTETDVDCGGTCPRCSEGRDCSKGDDCLSGNCVDGVCCESSCQQPCHSCLGAETGADDGTCVPVTEDTDPDDDCPDETALSCGSDGKCDGAGACRKYPKGTVCGASACKTTTIQSGPNECDGQGSCAPSPDTSCLPYACSPSSCKTSCTSELDCAPNNYCDTPSKTCLAKKPEGAACTANAECSSEVCKVGKCRPAQCGNAKLDVGETDFDCGGVCGATCGWGQKCSSMADCDPAKSSSCTGNPATCK